jgi:hypothetical protein
MNQRCFFIVLLCIATHLNEVTLQVIKWVVLKKEVQYIKAAAFVFAVYNVISHNGAVGLRRNMLSTTYHTIMNRVNFQFVNNKLTV